MRAENYESESVLHGFDDHLDFAARSGMLHDFCRVESKTQLNQKLKSIGFEKVPSYLKKGGIARRRGNAYFGMNGICERNLGFPPVWCIEVETSETTGKVVTGSVLHEMGHYVEQTVSNNGDFKYAYEFRGSSFDDACRYIGTLTWERKTDSYVVKAADELIANVNATWIAWASGIDPAHAVAVLLKQARQIELNSLRDVLDVSSEAMSEALTCRDYFEKEIESKGWSSEREMCEVMDAATGKLMRRLRRGLQRKKLTSQLGGHEDTHASGAYYGGLRKWVKTDGVGEKVFNIILDVETDTVAGIHCNPPLIRSKTGTYRVLSESERGNAVVTASIETPGGQTEYLDIQTFVERYPGFIEKTTRLLHSAGLVYSGNAAPKG